jgi:hypothetical protein
MENQLMQAGGEKSHGDRRAMSDFIIAQKHPKPDEIQRQMRCHRIAGHRGDEHLRRRRHEKGTDDSSIEAGRPQTLCDPEDRDDSECGQQRAGPCRVRHQTN